MTSTNGRPPLLSIVVPTRDEAGNIRLLLERLCQTEGIRDLSKEVIFVDDSDDGTDAVIHTAADQSPFPLRLIHRPPAARNGLSGAVVEGLRAAAGDWVVVMDGDLQHPPELLPALLQRARLTNADIVVGSRLATDAGPIGLSQWRGAASRWLTILARALFPQALKNVSDPLTGLFLVRRTAVNPDALRPEGFKILLEILVRARDARVSEVHFTFGERHSGESKAGLNEGMRFLRHLLRLRLTANQHMRRFLVAGALGILVNSLILVGLVVTGVQALLAAIIATQFSATWNFLVTESWVFNDRRQRNLTWLRLSRYLLMNNVLLAVHLPLMWLLLLADVHFIWANLAGIVATTLIRYALSDQWIWTQKSIPARPTYFYYNIHGILGIVSMVRLPELEYFRQEEPPEQCDIEVTVDRYGTPRCPPGAVCYDEGLGRLGFGVTIGLGQYTEVVVSPLLEKAPHVLYTNVVEPLLRWAFVRRGYALVHGTCVAYGDQAALVTSAGPLAMRTVLRAPLDEARAFLGDEMVLLGADGRVYAYPKPLLIGEHLLAQTRGIDPRFGERLLLVVQSRIYSWLGRRIGMGMRRLKLPAASLNAMIQSLFPPPKYMLHELQPGSRYGHAATLAAFVLLERGDVDERPLTTPEAADILLANLADAYAFPPYPILARALCEWEEIDLQPFEESIIRKGLGQATAARLRMPDEHWWQHLPERLRATEQPVADF